MRRVFAVLIAFFLLVVPAPLFAKSATSKIIISGGDLKSRIAITDRKVLANFRVWAGPATSSNETQWLIIDSSQGSGAERPKGLPRYEVSFYAKLPKERLVYVVFYEYDSSTNQGYVYLPGKADKWYRLNVSTIFHGVEGNWFRAWSLWDDAAKPVLYLARGTVVSPLGPSQRTSARMRTGPPEPPASLAGAATRSAPASGTALKSATFSR